MAKKQNRKKMPHAGLAALIDDLQARLNALGRMKSMSLLLLLDEPISRERVCAYRLEGHLRELRGIEVRIRAGIDVDLERMRLLKAEAVGYWNEIAAGRARAKRAADARARGSLGGKRSGAKKRRAVERRARGWKDRLRPRVLGLINDLYRDAEIAAELHDPANDPPSMRDITAFAAEVRRAKRLNRKTNTG